MKTNFIRGGLRVLLVLAYLFILIFGFLSGMFSESLIGSAHPMADQLADVIVWFGVAVSLSPAVCLLMANFLCKKPVIRRIVLAGAAIYSHGSTVAAEPYRGYAVIIPCLLITKPCSAP